MELTEFNTYNDGTIIQRSAIMKPIIFISHVTEEKDLAILLKNEIERVTFGMVDVFVSSDGESIQGGDRWFNTIIENLELCDMLICLASEQSISKPWISFELGYCFSKDNVKTIPLCHSGMFPGKLPSPINQLQALNFSEVADIKRILTYSVNLVPNFDASKFPINHLNISSDFFEKINKFEREYTLNSKAWRLIDQIQEKAKFTNGLFVKSNTGKEIDIEVYQHELSKVEDSLKSLEKLDLITIDFEQRGNTVMDINGFKKHVYITFEQKFKEIF